MMFSSGAKYPASSASVRIAASSAAMKIARAPWLAEPAGRARSAISDGRKPWGAPARGRGLSALVMRWRSITNLAPPFRVRASLRHLNIIEPLHRQHHRSLKRLGAGYGAYRPAHDVDVLLLHQIGRAHV